MLKHSTLNLSRVFITCACVAVGLASAVPAGAQTKGDKTADPKVIDDSPSDQNCHGYVSEQVGWGKAGAPVEAEKMEAMIGDRCVEVSGLHIKHFLSGYVIGAIYEWDGKQWHLIHTVHVLDTGGTCREREDYYFPVVETTTAAVLARYQKWIQSINEEYGWKRQVKLVLYHCPVVLTETPPKEEQDQVEKQK